MKFRLRWPWEFSVLVSESTTNIPKAVLAVTSPWPWVARRRAEQTRRAMRNVGL